MVNNKTNLKFKMKFWQLNLLTTVFFLLVYNIKLWQNIFEIVNPQGVAQYLFIVSIVLLLFIIINLILNLLCYKYSYKLIYLILFLGSASCLYFILQYNILIDRDMIQNIIETNPAEAQDLINSKLIMYMLVLGVIPTFALTRITIQFGTVKQAFLSRLKVFAFSLLTILGLLYLNYPSYASLARNNRHLSHLIAPTNFIFASISYIKQQLKSSNMPFKVITQGTKLDSSWENIKNKTVLVLVIGETARSDRFGINGYNKQTTPYLSNREIIDFTETYSCGTSTAISLPCIFSHLDRKSYSYNIAKNTENLLDFFVKTNFSVQWRDNNTGCKGICNRTDKVDLTHVEGSSFCESGECFDEILLDNLKNQILENANNQIIVLHQKGSHGPAYYLRYPKAFEKFKPVCKSNQLQDCSQLELNDAYDNTILYTDYFLDKAINVLEKLPANYNSSLIYISDHGESLGENNLYLHGTPYFMAPDAQTHVPFFTWMSQSFTHAFAINTSCLKDKQNLTFSHDNFFHSVLGLMHVDTPVYDADLDVFSSCKQADLIVSVNQTTL